MKFYPHCATIVTLFASAQMLLGALNTNLSTLSMSVYEAGAGKLTAYTDVPGLPPSDKYAIRVRSAATGNQWVPIFVHKTYNRQQELGDESVPKTDGTILATGVKNYLFFTGAWSHSYGNIEMTTNTPVEVEISSVNGFTIRNQNVFKAAVYPPHKASPATVISNKVYFTIHNPAQIVIDINGNMDDSNKALININDRNDIRHTVSLFANPIMEKPSLSDTTNVIAVEPGGPRPSDNLGAKTTLYFKPGVHQLGLDFKVRPGKKYYIPGDALVYGTFNNNDVPDSGGLKSGENIKVYGYGTISAQYTDHPDYVTNSVQDHYKGLIIRNALNTEVNGICFADPANHSCNIAAWGGRPDKSVPATFARWVKVISWRGNGDGLGNQHLTEDCFLRTNDDAGYIKGTKRGCTYWKDTSAAVYHMAGIPDPADFFPIVIEDCDVVYNRARTADGQVGGVFHNRAEGIPGQHTVDVTVRNFRIHDKLANRPVFNMFSESGPDNGSSYSGITFQNVSIASSLSKCTLKGSTNAPWYGGLTFDNVTFAGVLLTATNLGTYFNTNSFVSNIVFLQSAAYALTITNSGNGYVASSSALFDIPAGTTVTLSAIPSLGNEFASWGGAVSGTNNPAPLVMDGNKSVTANFIGSFTVTVSETNGTITLQPPGGLYAAGTVVTVTAIPDSGYAFKNWSGSLTGAINPTNLVVNGNLTVAALFEPLTTNTLIFNTPGTNTWTVPPGVNQVRIQAWGGGGVGGSALGLGTTNINGVTTHHARGGGGAGGSFAGAILAVTPGQVLSYTVGAGGAALDPAAITSHNQLHPAQHGGATAVSLGLELKVQALGGNGGGNALNSMGTVGLGGTGATAFTSGNTGDTGAIFYGGNGWTWTSGFSGSGGGSAGSAGAGGHATSSLGGAAGLGGGAAGGLGNTTANPGALGGSPGGGGAGAHARYGFDGARTGGAGGNGQLIISYSLETEPPVLAIKAISSGDLFEVTATNLNAAAVYELQGKAALTSQWEMVSIRSNVTETIWTISPLPGEPTKLFRVIKRN